MNKRYVKPIHFVTIRNVRGVQKQIIARCNMTGKDGYGKPGSEETEIALWDLDTWCTEGKHEIKD